MVCSHTIPSAVAREGGGNPQHPGEGCNGSAQTGNPRGDGSVYICGIYEDPGTESSPNRASWSCERIYASEPSDPDLSRNDTTWRSRATKLFPQRRSSTLAGCLAPRAALRDGSQSLASARAHGIKTAITCSTDCRVKLSAAGVKATKRTLRRGKKTVVLLRLPRGASRLSLRVEISAAGYRKRSTARARVRGSRLTLSAPDTVALLKP